MMRSRLVLAAALATCLVAASPGIAEPKQRPVTLGDLALFLEAGISDAVILLQLDLTGTTLNLSPDEIIQLHEAGASKELLVAILSREMDKEKKEDMRPPAGISFLPSKAASEEQDYAAPAQPGWEQTPLPPQGAADGFTEVTQPVPYPVTVEIPSDDWNLGYRSLPLGSNSITWPQVRTPYNRYQGSQVFVPIVTPHHSSTTETYGIHGEVHLSGQAKGVKYGVHVGAGNSPSSDQKNRRRARTHNRETEHKKNAPTKASSASMGSR